MAISCLQGRPYFLFSWVTILYIKNCSKYRLNPAYVKPHHGIFRTKNSLQKETKGTRIIPWNCSQKISIYVEKKFEHGWNFSYFTLEFLPWFNLLFKTSQKNILVLILQYPAWNRFPQEWIQIHLKNIRKYVRFIFRFPWYCLPMQKLIFHWLKSIYEI